MRIKFSLLLCIFMAVSSIASAQKTNKRTDEPKTNDNSVWFNARHGDAAAMNQIGVWYYTGNKVEKDYQKAYDWWRQGALLQNAKAIANLGVCYQYGRGVKRDSIEAIRLYLTAIENGQQELFKQRLANTPTSAFDDMLIGLCYEKGIGAKRNLKSAADMYALAAKKGSTDAMLAAGKAYMGCGNTTDALKYLDMAQARGNLYAGYLAGKLMLNNPANGTAKAVESISKAAEAGIPEAQAELGQMYLSGNGVRADRSYALQWLRRAAEGGDAEGMMQYAKALLLDKDYDEALFWMAMAVQAGRHSDFNALIKSLPQQDGFRKYLSGMKAYLIDMDYDRAASEFQSVGKAKSDDGKVMEMVVLADSNNPKSNAAKAVKELSKISDNNAFAAYALASMLIAGNGSMADNNRAVSLLSKAAKAGNGRAQCALADIYYEGRLATADRAAAADLYKKALQQRRLSATGLKNMTSLYETGTLGSRSNAAMASAIANYNAADPIAELLMTSDK